MFETASSTGFFAGDSPNDRWEIKRVGGREMYLWMKQEFELGEVGDSVGWFIRIAKYNWIESIYQVCGTVWSYVAGTFAGSSNGRI